jgi:sirohydrochlorin ferrochelatase
MTRTQAPADTALVLCAHGTRGLAGAVRAHAGALADPARFADVRGAALYGDPRLESVLDALPEPNIRLVPFMMAEGYTLDSLKRRVAEHAAAERIAVTRAVGVHPDLTDLIAQKARTAVAELGWSPGETALLLVGHGTEKHRASADTAEAHARRLRADGVRAAGFAEVATAFLDQAPTIPEVLGQLRAPRAIAVGFFTDAGNHGQDDVPAALAQSPVPARYAGPIGPDPLLRPVILELASAGAAAPSVVEVPS